MIFLFWSKSISSRDAWLKSSAPQERIFADEELGAPQAKEVRVVLRNCGKIDPLNIEDYIAEDGYMALAQVLTELTPKRRSMLIKHSGLRGRGGAGFPVGKKWELARMAPGYPQIPHLQCR